MERCLYNGVISGMSLDGKKFFYVNPLEAVPEASEKDYHKKHVKVERQKWFGCACCPPNVARLLSSIGGYAYEYNEKEIYMNLFIGGSMQAVLNGKKNQFRVETDYPWSGDVKIQVENEADTAFTYAIRVPGWCRGYSLKLNGEDGGLSCGERISAFRPLLEERGRACEFPWKCRWNWWQPIQKSGRMSVRWQ